MLLVGFAEFAKLFHHRLDEFFGVGEFLRDHTEVHRGNRGIAHAGAVDAVLADQDQGVGQAIEADGQSPAFFAKSLLVVFQFLGML